MRASLYVFTRQFVLKLLVDRCCDSEAEKQESDDSLHDDYPKPTE